MILSDLRDYLKLQHRVSLKDLSLHFDIEAEALRGMLDIWMAKGRVRKVTPLSVDCGTNCCKCDSQLIEFYEWI